MWVAEILRLADQTRSNSSWKTGGVAIFFTQLSGSMLRGNARMRVAGCWKLRLCRKRRIWIIGENPFIMEPFGRLLRIQGKYIHPGYTLLWIEESVLVPTLKMPSIWHLFLSKKADVNLCSCGTIGTLEGLNASVKHLHRTRHQASCIFKIRMAQVFPSFFGKNRCFALKSPCLW